MVVSLELLEKKLKLNGHSITKPRKITFETLVQSNIPLTMQELIRRTNKKIDRASVYRTIDLFESNDITQRIYSGWKYKLELSDAFQEHHHHFTCSNCGLVIPINNQTLEDDIDKISKETYFKTVSHQLEIQGICNKCQ